MGQIKRIKNNLVSSVKTFWADESAQGMTEYILLLVIILAIATLFRTEIEETVKGKIGDVKSSIMNFK
jgi:Flp pilus assembly pilin Flp